MGLNTIKGTGNWGGAASDLNNNFATITAEIEKLKAANVKFKGYYTSEATLKAVYSSPAIGDNAWVGATYPGTVYECKTAGTWSNTGKTPSTPSVSLADYATKTLVDVRTTEYNVSVQHPTSGIDSTNKYTLSGAVAMVPSSLRTVGLKCSFLDVDGKVETWEYQGGTFTNTGNWKQQSSGGNKILEWNTDTVTTRKQVAANERKPGMQISYKNADGEWVNEQYVGTAVSDVEWAKDTNWEQMVHRTEFSELSEKTYQLNDSPCRELFGGSVFKGFTFKLPKDKSPYCNIKIMNLSTSASIYIFQKNNPTEIKPGNFASFLYRDIQNGLIDVYAVIGSDSADAKIVAENYIGLLNSLKSVMLLRTLNAQNIKMEASDFPFIDNGDTLMFGAGIGEGNWYVREGALSGPILLEIPSGSSRTLKFDKSKIYYIQTSSNNTAVLDIYKSPNDTKDFINVDEYLPLTEGYYSKAEARNAIHIKDRRLNLVITYKTSISTSLIEKYTGSDISAWDDNGNWKEVLNKDSIPYIDDVLTQLLGSEEKELFDTVLTSNKVCKLPAGLRDTDLVEIELSGFPADGFIYCLDDKGHEIVVLRYTHDSLIIPYCWCKGIRLHIPTSAEVGAKARKLKSSGRSSVYENRMIYRGSSSFAMDLSSIGVKAGDILMVKNIADDSSADVSQVYIYNSPGTNEYIAELFPNIGIYTPVNNDTYIKIQKPNPGINDTIIELYIASDYTKMQYPFFKECDFISAGDSITAWLGSTSNELPIRERFFSWSYLLHYQVCFKSYKNIAVPGASYITSSASVFSIYRSMRNIPEGYEGILIMMGGTNDYDHADRTNNLGSAEDSLSKTYDELVQRDASSNQKTVCDGFRLCLETAIRRCSWKARIFVMTCPPRNEFRYFSVHEMNEQFKIIAKSFHIPVFDLFNEIDFRNGFDQYGETWKLSEYSSDGSTKENLHPNGDAQKIMMRYVLGKLLSFISDGN